MSIEIIDRSFSEFFSGIVGQTRIVSILERAVQAYSMGGGVPSYAFIGQAGLGKTHLMRSLEAAMARALEMRKESANQILWVRSPEKFRLMSSDESTTVKAFCREVRPGVMFVDEFHEASSGYVGPMKKAFLNFLKDALAEDAARGADIKWGDDEERVHVSRETFGCNVATNYPEQLKDAPAIFRRFDAKLNLDLLSEENVAEITHRMLAEREIRCDNETTLAMIARCGRGTCELPSKIATELEKVARISGKRSVNRAEVAQSLRDLERYPRGITRLEMRVLEMCANGAQKTAGLAIMLGAEEKAIKQAINYLFVQRTSGKGTPFAETAGSSWIRTTPNGQKFLDVCRVEKFTW